MEYKREFWENLYDVGDTGWDIGYPSTPIKDYIDQIHDKQQHILIPGAGNSYEAEYLHTIGYQNVFILDISEQPLSNFLDRVPSFPADNIIHQNFFDHEGEYDLILEQTFFCALEKTLRAVYVEKMHSLLCEGGLLVGLLFNDPLNEDHPPYGGDKEQYKDLFKPFFNIDIMEPCYNSIGPRDGKELFIKLRKS